MRHRFIGIDSILISLISFFLAEVKGAHAQGMARGEQGRKESIYFNNSYLKNKEVHYELGVKVPVFKKESYSHEVAISNKYSNINYDEIRNKFGENRFYTSKFSWMYKQKRRNNKHLPWSSTLSYEVNGSKFIKKGRENLSFRVMTGHRNKESMHNYGVALSSNGGFKGIPFPFYVYTTKMWEQSLTVGFPFLSISGPRKNKTNYQITLSPMGAMIKGSQQVNEKMNLNTFWSYTFQDYVIDSDQFTQRESIFLEKQTLAVESVYQLSKIFSLNFSVGREFSRRYFKGQNIFKKESTKYGMVSSNFLKTGIGFTFF